MYCTSLAVPANESVPDMVVSNSEGVRFDKTTNSVSEENKKSMEY